MRILLTFVAVGLLAANNAAARWTGLAVMITAALLDAADGYIARRSGTASPAGGMFDIAGDRIYENVLILFFTAQQLIPVAAGMIFIARSFLADFLRTLHFARGVTAFGSAVSPAGRLLVASTASRAAYQSSKLILFTASALVLITRLHFGAAAALPVALTSFLRPFSYAVAGFCVLRFMLLLGDSREVLAAYFTHEKDH